MRLFVISFALLIGGCANNPNIYLEPDKNMEGVSAIEGSEIRESMLTWGKYSIFKINGQSMSFWR